MRQVQSSVISAAIRFFLSCISSAFVRGASVIVAGDFDIACNRGQSNFLLRIVVMLLPFPFPLDPHLTQHSYQTALR